MTDHSRIKRVIDVTDDEIAEAVEDREATRALLAHLAKVSQPRSGCSKVLLVFGRMATAACEWLDGGLRVEVVEDGSDSVVESYLDLGGNMRERLFPPMRFKAPYREFTDALERAGHLIAPLAVVAQSSGRVAVSVTVSVRMSSLPPPPVAIADESLFNAPAAPRAPSIDMKTPAAPLVTQEILELLKRRTTSPAPAQPLPPVRPPVSSVPDLGTLDRGWGDEDDE